jgi:hypothetical protein
MRRPVDVKHALTFLFVRVSSHSEDATRTGCPKTPFLLASQVADSVRPEFPVLHAHKELFLGSVVNPSRFHFPIRPSFQDWVKLNQAMIRWHSHYGSAPFGHIFVSESRLARLTRGHRYPMMRSGALPGRLFLLSLSDTVAPRFCSSCRKWFVSTFIAPLPSRCRFGSISLWISEESACT